jgi:predicted transposase YbfD/YdcC
MDAAPLALRDVFSRLTDPRSPRGRRHPLPALLSLTVVALLSGYRSLEAIAEFGRLRGAALAKLLGFTHDPLPCKATLSNVFCRLDLAAFEQALADWLRGRCPSLGDHLALDGKTLRGSRHGEAPGVHLLAAYAPQVAGVVAQIRVDGKTNEYKAALELLGVLPLEGKVVTGDAMFCQKDFCEKVIDEGGDYLVTVKDNQPTLHFEIAALFAESTSFSPLPTPALAARAPKSHDAQQRARPA